jgi:GNAT superfamily N-acetyltransferase/putative sterol carrier protein
VFVAALAQEALGFTEAAAQLRGQILASAAEAPVGYDLTRAGDYHHKGFWALDALREKHGPDFLARLVTTVPKEKAWEGFPWPFTTDSDVAIYYLSLALGEDLFPWFASIGTTVHPIPLVPKVDEGFAEAMRQCTEEGLRNGALPLSDRVDALAALAGMNRGKEGVPPAAERLQSDDAFARLAAAFELGQDGDQRAAGALQGLAEGEDEALSAMASLLLARAGHRAAGARLVALAPSHDARFALDAGHVGEQLGVEGADALRLEELTLADGTRPGAWEIECDGLHLRVWATVEGYRVANVFAQGGPAHFPRNCHVRELFVQWVHTSDRYRRKGLSRGAMARVFDHPLARGCSCMALGTGTRNVAHALYRSFGFVDRVVETGWQLELGRAHPGPAPEGVSFRSFRPGDEGPLARLMETCSGNTGRGGAPRAEPLSGPRIVKVAERDGELVGAVGVWFGFEQAYLSYLIVKEGDARFGIAAALLGLLPSELRDRGANRIMWWSEPPATEFVERALAAAGFEPVGRWGVEMWGLLSLPQFLGEITPLLERRLADSDLKGWTGSIDLRGEKHQARLTFSEGKASTADASGTPTGIAVACDDETLSRILCGAETPFEAYLQTRARITPWVGERTVHLLETLFPNVGKTG